MKFLTFSLVFLTFRRQIGLIQYSILQYNLSRMGKKTLVIGASENPSRYSYLAIGRLLANQHEVVAIGAKKGEALGVQIDKELMPYDDIDTITLYVNPMRQKEYYEYILRLEPKRVIFNPGTENPELYNLLHQNNIEVDVACTLVLLSMDQY